MSTVAPPKSKLVLLLEMIRFSHTIFALPFALLSAALAWQETGFRALDLLGIVLCMVCARSAAMVHSQASSAERNGRTGMADLPADATLRATRI